MAFRDERDKLIDLIKDEISVLKWINEEMKIDKDNFLYGQFREEILCEGFGDALENWNQSLSMIERANVKCVTFGNTSNGKSAVLNALLRENIFPSDIGRVTSCFICLKGSDEENNKKFNKEAKIKEIDEIIIAAGDDNDKEYNITSKVDVLWPRTECDLLKDDIEIWDSPGVDFSEDDDTQIKEYCRDADVFLLVINGCSSLTLSEKNFFLSLNKKIVIPSIFCLINKWDLVKNKDKMRKKKSYEKAIKDFLTELGMDRNVKIEDRIFFISAINPELSENRVVFDRFRNELKDDLNTNAIRLKLKGNMERLIKTSKTVSELFGSLKKYLGNKTEWNPDELNRALLEQLTGQINETISEIKTFFDERINLVAKRLSGSIRIRIRNKSSFLPKIIKSHIPSNQNTGSDIDDTNDTIEKTFKSLIDLLRDVFENKIKDLAKRSHGMFKQYSYIENKEALMMEYLDKCLNLDCVIERFNRYRESEMRRFQGQIQIICYIKDDKGFQYCTTMRLLKYQIKNLKKSIDRKYEEPNQQNEGFAPSRKGTSGLGCSSGSSDGSQNVNSFKWINNDQDRISWIYEESINGSGYNNLPNESIPMSSIPRNDSLFQQNKENEFEQGIEAILTEHFNTIIKIQLDQTKKTIVEIMTNCASKFFTDQNEVFELYDKMEEQMKRNEDVMTKLGMFEETFEKNTKPIL